MKYRKKPIVIEAMQLLDNKYSIEECIRFMYSILPTESNIETVKTSGYLLIPTLEGDMKAFFGDYIIKGIYGEFYPCKPDIFEKTYENIE